MKVNILKIAVLLLFLAGSFLSCEKDDKQKLPIMIIGGGNGGGGIDPKQDKVIKSQKEWESLLMALPKSEVDYFSETEIDFNIYIIIVIIDKVRPSTGWSFYVSCIIEYYDRIVVTVNVKAPSGIALTVLTQPYQIVKIPVTTKSIEFHHID